MLGSVNLLEDLITAFRITEVPGRELFVCLDHRSITTRLPFHSLDAGIKLKDFAHKIELSKIEQNLDHGCGSGDEDEGRRCGACTWCTYCTHVIYADWNTLLRALSRTSTANTFTNPNYFTNPTSKHAKRSWPMACPHLRHSAKWSVVADENKEEAK